VPPRAGLSPARVADAALALLDGDGEPALTLAAVAGRLGVATPSLYKHVDGLAGLRRQVRLRVLAELDDALREATVGRAGAAALAALAGAYRDYLRAHPHRHPYVDVAPADPETAAAAERVVAVAYAVVRGFGLEGAAAVHAIRCLRASVHGFAHLEAIGGFGLPEDVDATFDALVEMVTAGVTRLAGQGSTTRARK
jgi:AcrR family transcriptional regulator